MLGTEAGLPIADRASLLFTRRRRRCCIPRSMEVLVTEISNSEANGCYASARETTRRMATLDVVGPLTPPCSLQSYPGLLGFTSSSTVLGLHQLHTLNNFTVLLLSIHQSYQHNLLYYFIITGGWFPCYTITLKSKLYY